MGILQRYVLRELLVDFAYSLSMITSIFFIAAAAQLLYTFHDFNVLSIVQLFPLLVPFSLAYTVPVSVLIATVLTFGRLTAEREILAIRTSGVHLGRVIGPALLLGLVLASGTFYLNSTVIPYCHRMRQRVLQDALEKFLASFDRGVRLISFERFQLAWSERDDEGRMRQIIFTRLSERGVPVQQVRAKSGRITVDRDTNRLRLELNDGSFPIDREREETARIAERPEKRTGAPRARPVRPADDLAAAGFEPHISGVGALAQGEADPTRPRESGLVATTFRGLALSYSLDDLFVPDKKAPKIRERPSQSLRVERDETEKAARRAELDTEIQKRIANSVACFAFALIGTPLGILVRRGNRLVAFFVSFLVVSLVYYPLSMAGEALGSVGRVPPLVSVWWANGALVALGAVLLRAVFRR